MRAVIQSLLGLEASESSEAVPAGHSLALSRHEAILRRSLNDAGLTTSSTSFLNGRNLWSPYLKYRTICPRIDKEDEARLACTAKHDSATFFTATSGLDDLLDVIRRESALVHNVDRTPSVLATVDHLGQAGGEW
jgi:hypothetical protein